MSQRQDIRKLPKEALDDFLKSHGEPAFRSKQVWEWIWEKSACTFGEMTNLSLKTKQLLESHYEFRPIELHTRQVSKDRTIKFGFKLYDDNIIESVLIPTDDRMTACVSSQVGCSLTCKFCATGYMERVRNLDPAEIYDQVVAVRENAASEYHQPLTNIVFMGMGEPLLNYQNVLKAIDRIVSPEGLGMSYKRITLSTAGIAKMITKLADDGFKCNLALSLHAANDTKRNTIMPINEQNSLEALRDALKYYYDKTQNPVTYEYIVFDQFNDSLQDAAELYAFTTHVPCKINIIEYNPIKAADFKNAREDRLESFAHFLQKKGLNVTLRRSRGKDIDAACGQLAVNSQEQSSEIA